MRNGDRQFSRGDRRRCYRCNGFGHIARDCDGQENDESSSKRGGERDRSQSDGKSGRDSNRKPSGTEDESD